MHWDSNKLRGNNRVGPVRAEWGWGRVGHALGFNKITLRLRISTKALGFNYNYSETTDSIKLL